MRRLSIILALAGLALGTAVVAWFGADHVATAVLQVDWHGFALLVAWQMLLFLILGLAWRSIVPGFPVPVVIWGRMVRDAAATCLPFSHVGGFVLGARAMTLHGMSWPLAAGSTIADVTAEFLAQVAFAAFGLAVLLIRAPDAAIAWPVAGGLILAVALGAGFIWLQKGAGPVFRALGGRIAGSWYDSASMHVDALQTEFSRVYSHPGRLALGATLHLLAWFGTGSATWVTYRLLGVDIDLLSALAIEGLLHAVLAATFLVPGNVGVQELAYAGIGTVFGLPPEDSLGVSLVRRARDLAVGIPILLIYQLVEARRLRRRLRHNAAESVAHTDAQRVPEFID